MRRLEGKADNEQGDFAMKHIKHVTVAKAEAKTLRSAFANLKEDLQDALNAFKVEKKAPAPTDQV